jgi:multidrug efflux system membrane fusion protein
MPDYKSSPLPPDASSTAPPPPPKPEAQKKPGFEKKKGHWWIWALVIAVLLIAGFVYYRHKSAADAAAAAKAAATPHAVPVVTATARKGSIGDYVEALGTVTPVFTVQVTARVQGQIMAGRSLGGYRPSALPSGADPSARTTRARSSAAQRSEH